MALRDAAAHGLMSAGGRWRRQTQGGGTRGPATGSGWGRFPFHHFLLRLHPEGGWGWWDTSAHPTFQTCVGKGRKYDEENKEYHPRKLIFSTLTEQHCIFSGTLTCPEIRSLQMRCRGMETASGGCLAGTPCRKPSCSTPDAGFEPSAPSSLHESDLQGVSALANIGIITRNMFLINSSSPRYHCNTLI